MTSPAHKGNILVVDDTAANLKLLVGILKEDGYKARPVTSGALALEALKSELPDLILLDIEMPEMNGYELCLRLKENPQYKDVPVLFISALSETSEKVKAFEVGGVDYVTKPFQFEEIRARVRTHLTLHRLQMDLQRRYQELRELQDLRDNLTHMIVHDLRSPLTGIKGYLQLLQLDADKLGDEQLRYVNKALKTVSSMVDMIGSLLDVNRLESGEMPLQKAKCDLRATGLEIAGAFEGLMTERTFQYEGPADPVYAMADYSIVRRVLANLMGNAVKFTPTSGTITMAVWNRDGKPRVEIRDTGHGIPAQYLERVFDKFAQVEARQESKGYSTGLGLTFCKLAMEAHGGTIGVESEVGKGSTFWFEFPE